MTRRFIKRPLVIEAFKFGTDDQPEWSEHSGKVIIVVSPNRVCAYIDTLEGRMTAEIGDYIIKGIKGEIYSCKADIFEETYDKYPEEKIENNNQLITLKSFKELKELNISLITITKMNYESLRKELWDADATLREKYLYYDKMPSIEHLYDIKINVIDDE